MAQTTTEVIPRRTNRFADLSAIASIHPLIPAVLVFRALCPLTHARFRTSCVTKTSQNRTLIGPDAPVFNVSSYVANRLPIRCDFALIGNTKRPSALLI